MKDKKYYGLCHRCEWRADYKETGNRPRYECGMDTAVVSCYMYRPVAPLILKRNKGDRRPPLAGAMLSARMYAIGVADGEYTAIKRKNGIVAYWRPKNEKIQDKAE